MPESTRPTHATLAVVFQVRSGKLQVLLWERAKEPDAGAWSLPGGYLEAGETLEQSIRKHLAEKVDVRQLSHLEQLETRSDPERHPRGWQLATAYLGVVALGEAAGAPLGAREGAGRGRLVPPGRVPRGGRDARAVDPQAPGGEGGRAPAFAPGAAGDAQRSGAPSAGVAARDGLPRRRAARGSCRCSSGSARRSRTRAPGPSRAGTSRRERRSSSRSASTWRRRWTCASFRTWSSWRRAAIRSAIRGSGSSRRLTSASCRS